MKCYRPWLLLKFGQIKSVQRVDTVKYVATALMAKNTSLSMAAAMDVFRVLSSALEFASSAPQDGQILLPSTRNGLGRLELLLSAVLEEEPGSVRTLQAPGGMLTMGSVRTADELVGMSIQLSGTRVHFPVLDLGDHAVAFSFSSFEGDLFAENRTGSVNSQTVTLKFLRGGQEIPVHDLPAGANHTNTFRTMGKTSF